VAEKLQHSVDTSFRRPVRGGSESAQLESLSELIEGVILSNSCDRWFWDMNGSGSYRVKDVRNMLDDFLLPKDEVATRWLPHLLIKLNVFAWRLYLDRLPTKSNLIRRGIQVIFTILCFSDTGLTCSYLPIRIHQSSESLDFEVLIVGYEHVVMNCGSAGNRFGWINLQIRED
nr:RNA-directed DNA polymerase, eukaryota [Tanacetum cinerariifolium]